MLKPGGYATIFGPLGVEWEGDTFTCIHCNSKVDVKPFCDPADLGGQCRLCDKPICPKCVGGPCLPFEKKLEQVEARDRWHRAYNI